jgi:hypothetical protein
VAFKENIFIVVVVNKFEKSILMNNIKNSWELVFIKSNTLNLRAITGDAIIIYDMELPIISKDAEILETIYNW